MAGISSAIAIKCVSFVHMRMSLNDVIRRSGAAQIFIIFRTSLRKEDILNVTIGNDGWIRLSNFECTTTVYRDSMYVVISCMRVKGIEVRGVIFSLLLHYRYLK